VVKGIKAQIDTLKLYLAILKSKRDTLKQESKLEFTGASAKDDYIVDLEEEVKETSAINTYEEDIFTNISNVSISKEEREHNLSNNIKIKIYKANMVELKLDAIVNSIGPNPEFKSKISIKKFNFFV
jgi:hypothetical protein